MAYCPACGAEIDADANYCPRCGSTQNVADSETLERHESISASSFAGRTWTNALIGGTAGFVLAAFVASIFFPMYVVGVLAGAALAGYLHDRGEWSGATVGLLAGVVATVPVLLVVVLGAMIGFGGLVVSVLGHLGTETSMLGFGLLGILGIVVFMVTVIANLVFGALGGFIGGALGEP